MKIIKITKPENADQQLKDLKEGLIYEHDFQLIVENKDNEPDEYMGKLIITKISEEEKPKSRRRFSIKKLKYLTDK